MAYGIQLKKESDGSLQGVIRQNPFPGLVDGSTVAWDCGNDKFPQAKLTSTQSFTINMTNVLDGAQGVLKLITNTASAITLTFDTDFTNKTLNTTLTTYTFPALTGQEYFLSFVVVGTAIEWVIGDVTQYSNVRQWARVSRAAVQSLGNNSIVAISFDTESTDNANIFSSGNPTRLTIPGSGNKIATVSALISYPTSATGIRRIIIYKNGSNAGQGDGVTVTPNSGTTTDVQATFQVECSGGDYLEVMGQQNSGGSQNVTAHAHIKIEDR